MSGSASLSGTGLGKQTSSLNARSADASKPANTRALGNFHGTTVTLGSPWRFKPAGVYEVQRRFDAVLKETGTVSIFLLMTFRRLRVRHLQLFSTRQSSEHTHT
jgi:hypothetical protein